MTLVVDASVALKWVLEEADVDRAVALVGSDSLIAPDFLILECANVLAMQVKRGVLLASDAREKLVFLTAAAVGLRASSVYVDRAQSLAMELGHTVYDCLYLAVALAEQATVVTADARFLKSVTSDATYASHIRLL